MKMTKHERNQSDQMMKRRCAASLSFIISSLVPKLHLGTHLSAKLCFVSLPPAEHSRHAKCSFSPQVRSPTELGNEGRKKRAFKRLLRHSSFVIRHSSFPLMPANDEEFIKRLLAA